ncbi:Leucine Rich Repeat [Seminavis robusta]|uniref:Leucine Rich Repeat n=1 Tax=Seminavis robusta TaxID=568900 RepID=A0A9N8DQF8_9STRA|nr:Leucine Rich Repeat [Seminavis robusta]|eukprot:Sro210_g087760.1 Leucine Rich Repeat (808) ;mRNA; f:78305-80811
MTSQAQPVVVDSSKGDDDLLHIFAASSGTSDDGLNVNAEKDAARNSVGAALATGEAQPISEASTASGTSKDNPASGASEDIPTKEGKQLASPGVTVGLPIEKVDDRQKGKEKADSDDRRKDKEKTKVGTPSKAQDDHLHPASSNTNAPGLPPLPLQRGVNMPNSRPGAVAIGGFGMITPAGTSISRPAQGSSYQPYGAATAMENDGSMAQARLVDMDEEGNIQNADPVEEGALRLSMGGSNKGNVEGREACKTVLLIAVIGFIVLALVLTLRGGNKEEDTSNGIPTMAPTGAPSLAPTDSPTMYAVTLGLPDYSVDKILKDETSPQARAYSWIMDDPNQERYPDWRILQRFALATFYYSTGGPSWDISDNWLNHSLDECKDWFFRTETDGLDVAARDDKIFITSPCDESGKYQYLLMAGNNLAGRVPEEIGMLSSLLIFDYFKNDGLEGSTIPTEIGLLTNLLRLSADRNFHGGKLPTEIGMMTSLIEVYLGYNPFPSPIPSEIANIQGLQKLNLNRAGFTGTVPSELFTLTKMVEFFLHGLLDIENATLEGIGQMTDLQAFYFHNLPLHNTPIPTELGLATKLEKLNLWDTGLTGTIPSEMANLSGLKRLDIDDNRLTGSLPDFIWELPLLQEILYDGNFFTGTLPSHVWQNLTLMEGLAFSDNLLSGSIPTEVGLLPSIQTLRFDRNAFTGTIPTEIGNLTTLEEVFFHDTHLEGNIPLEFEDLLFLETITFSNTSLTGSIPAGICDSLVDIWFSCHTKFGITLPTCTVVEVEDFDCASSLLCGCSCSACAVTGTGFVFNRTLGP